MWLEIGAAACVVTWLVKRCWHDYRRDPMQSGPLMSGARVEGYYVTIRCAKCGRPKTFNV